MPIFENSVNQQQVLHYALVIGYCATLQKILDTITVETELSKQHKEEVHYADAKEHQSTCVKNAMLDCIQAVLKHAIFLKYRKYKRLYNSFCIKFAFVVVCINKII